MVYFLKLTQP